LRALLTGFLLLPAVAVAAPLLLQAGESKPLAVLKGKLVSTPGGEPVLRVHGNDQSLSAITPYLFHTLQDARLANRDVRVEGAAKPGGTFEVERLYTIRKGKPYRVRYFCDVCNIEALEPGNCVCCQRPTEIQEIPVSEEK
jgi:hypothetical protein